MTPPTAAPTSARAVGSATPAGTIRPVRYGAVDLGVEMARRDLSYSGVTPSVASPLKVSAPGIVSPAVRGEILPFAGVERRWYTTALVFAGYSRSVGLATEEPAGARAAHGTAVTRLEVGGGLRVWPFESARLFLTPRLSYRTFSVKVSPRGAIPGLADVDLAGPRAGVDLEAPFGSRYALLAGGGFTWWTRAKELVGSGGFFSSGSAWDVDASAGLSVGIHGPFSIRALFDFTRTSYRLSGASVYRATGATDTLIGGRVLARVTF
jgi:hypothetical protein